MPLQFDEATNRTIELIDVVWLQKTTIIAAFEIESTTSMMKSAHMRDASDSAAVGLLHRPRLRRILSIRCSRGS